MWHLRIRKDVHPDGTVTLHHFVTVPSGLASAGMLRLRADEARDYLAAIQLGRPDSMQIEISSEVPSWPGTS